MNQNPPGETGVRPPRLMDKVRDEVRARHYSPRTEKAYCAWIRRYILFHGRRHPRELGPEAIEAFLTHLATEGHVSASTQNQALAALLVLYVRVLAQPTAWLSQFVRAKRPERLPATLTAAEVMAVLDPMNARRQLHLPADDNYISPSLEA